MRSHIATKTVMCRLCRGALRAPAYELKLISFLTGGEKPPLRRLCELAGRRDVDPYGFVRSHFVIKTAICRVAKRGFFVCLQTEKHLRQARQK